MISPDVPSAVQVLEREGWTTDALFPARDEAGVAREVMSAVVCSPAAAAAGPPDRQGGGRFGGGVATGGC